MVPAWGSSLGRLIYVTSGSIFSMRGHIMSQETERRNFQSPRVSFRAGSQYRGSWHKAPPAKGQRISCPHHPGASLHLRISEVLDAPCIRTTAVLTGGGIWLSGRTGVDREEADSMVGPEGLSRE